MKYLKVFDTTAEYNAFKLTDNFATPNVSLCEDSPTVMHYEPYVAPVAPVQTHEWVEIGGIKWATMNLGAENITGDGLYYQWGDTQGYTEEQVGNGSGQKYFSESDYKYYNNGDYTKYNDNDGLITLLPEDDAVTVAWGGNWRMPTESECQMLEESTNMDWISDYQGSGVSGYTFTDKTDSSKVLFFPINKQIINGNIYSTKLSYEDPKGFIWTSSLASGRYDVSDAQDFPNSYHAYGIERYCGRGIRGILDE